MFKKMLNCIAEELGNMSLGLKLVIGLILVFVVGSYIIKGLTLIFIFGFVCIVGFLFFTGNQSYPFSKH